MLGDVKKREKFLRDGFVKNQMSVIDKIFTKRVHFGHGGQRRCFGP